MHVNACESEVISVHRIPNIIFLATENSNISMHPLLKYCAIQSVNCRVIYHLCDLTCYLAAFKHVNHAKWEPLPVLTPLLVTLAYIKEPHKEDWVNDILEKFSQSNSIHVCP
jgi:hypothetical protein